MTSRLLVVAGCLAISLVPRGAQAQRWTEIGVTSDQNKVYVNRATIVRNDSIVTATIRVVYTTPKSTPQGPINGSRSVAMFNCLRKTVAVKENIIWHDEAKGTIYLKRAPAIPGFGPVFNSNFSGVALRYLCDPPAPPR